MLQVRKFFDLSLDQVELKLDGGGVGTFEGYAARFGSVDSVGDTIMKGAFQSTLRQNGKPKLMWAHDWNGMPIGLITKAQEDDSGLFIKGQLTPGHTLANDIHAALKHGTMDGLSVGGFIKKGDAVDKEDGNGQTINKFTRLVEVSIVPFPADAGARVDSATVRGEELDLATEIAGLETIREAERFLRDVGPFSKPLASTFVSRLKSILLLPSGDPKTTKADDEGMSEMLERLARIGKLAR